MGDIIQQVVRLKIITPVHPTNSWKEFRTILKQLHEETRLASNRCITHCNMEYCHNIDEKYACKDKKKLQNELYNIARKYAHRYRILTNPTVAMTVIRLYTKHTALNIKPMINRIAHRVDCVSLDIFFI